MLDEFPTLEFAASAVAVALCLRVLILLRQTSALVRSQARLESARARNLVGAAVLASAVVYALRVERASVWFLTASALAILAQVVGFYLRLRARPKAEAPAAASDVAASSGSVDEPPGDADDVTIEIAEDGCPACGTRGGIELRDTTRLLGGLAAFGDVEAIVCQSCGTLRGQVEDPARIPIGPEHGTALIGETDANEEPLEEPQEHQG